MTSVAPIERALPVAARITPKPDTRQAYGAPLDDNAVFTVRVQPKPPTMPVLPTPLLARERLRRHLDAASAAPIVLITAPAGWGKTTLISSWVNARADTKRIRYFAFDADPDNDLPAALTDAIADAIAAAAGSTDGSPTSVPAASTFVFDNVHRASRAATTAIQHLLAHADERLKVVLLSRIDPPLPLYRWRLTGRLHELRADRLSFTVEETAQLLQASGLPVSARTARRLHDVTEGWPAALALAAASMLAHAEPESVVDELWTDTGGIAAYIRDEVLGQLPGNLRDALMRLSVLERTCPGLVEALTGRRDGARTLAELEHRTGLVLHCGGGDSWYRCHRLLRIILQVELRKRYPTQVRESHQAAAEWYTLNHLPSEGLTHALCAADWSRACAILHEHWPEILASRGLTITTSAPAPPDEASTNPLLALAFAVQRRLAGDVAGMRAFLRTAESAASSATPDGRLTRLLDAVRMVDAQYADDAARVLALAEKVAVAGVEEPGPDEDTVKALALCAVSHAHLVSGELTAMERATADAVPLARWAGSTGVYLNALGQAAMADLVRGRLATAAHRARLILSAARNAGLARGPDAGIARLVLAGICLQRGQLDDAAYHLNLMSDGHASADSILAIGHSIALAKLYQLRGEPLRALEMLRPAYDHHRAGSPLLASANLMQAELQLATGEPVLAWRLLAEAVAHGSASAWTVLVESKLLLAERRPEQALERWKRLPDPEPTLPVAVEACLVRAQALSDLGDAGASWRMVERALQLAEPERICRPFLVNPGVRHLLIAHLSNGTGFADALLELVHADGREPAATAEIPQALVDPLTEREYVVLQYLNSTLSAAEIAGVLHVSTNTVKTHMKNVYRKLDVGRRRDAVRRGHELGLR